MVKAEARRRGDSHYKTMNLILPLSSSSSPSLAKNDEDEEEAARERRRRARQDRMKGRDGEEPCGQTDGGTNSHR